MRKNKISIIINNPVSEVFNFAINPLNTPKWIKSIVKEETNEWPVQIGSIYRNIDTAGKWTKYIVTKLEKDRLFELTCQEEGYHVSYSFIPVTDESSELEYFEWVNKGELPSPFSQEVLKELKMVMEN